ncbi:hypothetical protein [Parahaliea aestuarii]|uniref:TIGR02646 family protein n=1 Tax=Parahaliea aestuarii TaxID=1852021 RepID=A0A5C8ZUL3_9GAMM|nr:hypothetical protein [Parahaliea aestuarii]TXS92215.1 hypothetical protein FVW59_07225 [Parahaliea aestuarii]
MMRVRFPADLPEEIQVWKARAHEITLEIVAAPDLEAKYALIELYKNHWRAPVLIQWLSDLSHEKCWYTETKFGGDYQEVEHFRPKKGTKCIDGTDLAGHPGYYWLAFDLENYRLCKRRPNAKKGTFFPILNEPLRCGCEVDDWHDELPLFLDPMDEEDYLLLSFDDNGKPVPQEGAEDQDRERVLFTIDKYYLDERILNIRRAQVWASCREIFNSYQNAMKEAKLGNGGVAKRAEAKRDLRLLRQMISRQAEFSSVAKAALIKTGDPMAARIAAS